MRTKIELQSKEFNDDMSELCQLLNNAKLNISRKDMKPLLQEVLNLMDIILQEDGIFILAIFLLLKGWPVLEIMKFMEGNIKNQ